MWLVCPHPILHNYMSSLVSSATYISEEASTWNARRVTVLWPPKSAPSLYGDIYYYYCFCHYSARYWDILMLDIFPLWFILHNLIIYICIVHFINLSLCLLARIIIAIFISPADWVPPGGHYPHYVYYVFRLTCILLDVFLLSVCIFAAIKIFSFNSF